MYENGMRIETVGKNLVITWGDGSEDTVVLARQNIEQLLRKAYRFGSRAGYGLGYREGGRDESSRNNQSPGWGDMGG